MKYCLDIVLYSVNCILILLKHLCPLTRTHHVTVQLYSYIRKAVQWDVIDLKGVCNEVFYP